MTDTHHLHPDNQPGRAIRFRCGEKLQTTLELPRIHADGDVDDVTCPTCRQLGLQAQALAYAAEEVATCRAA